MIWDRGRMDKWDVPAKLPGELARVTDTIPVLCNTDQKERTKYGIHRCCRPADRGHRCAQEDLSSGSAHDRIRQGGIPEAQVRSHQARDRASGRLAATLEGNRGGDGID